MGFRDPSGEVFELLRLAQGIEDAAKSVAAIEGLYRVAQEVIQGESSGLTQRELDRIDDALQRARAEMVETRRRYRDGLGTLKVELGLAPGAPAYLDRSGVAAFREVFDEAAKWAIGPGLDYASLDAIAASLPALEDVVIEGRSLLAEVRRRDGDLDEDFLKAATAVATRNRGAGPPGVSDDAMLLRVRGGVRALRETFLFYELEKRRFVLVSRARVLAQGQLFAPAAGAMSLGTAQVADLVGLQDELRANRDRLVALWTSYQARRLALARDLGALPADDWPGFFASLTARKAGPGPR